MTEFTKDDRLMLIENVANCLPWHDDTSRLMEAIADMTPDELRTIMEICYRRGFQQGAVAAMDSGDDDWLYEVATWRFNNHGPKREIPPIPQGMFG